MYNHSFEGEEKEDGSIKNGISIKHVEDLSGKTKNGIYPDLPSSNSSCSLKVEEGITFSFNNLSVSTREVKTNPCCGMKKGKVIPPKVILNNVSGVVRPGELLAMMGASGAGKSTLLNTLLFRNLGNLKVTGKRTANKTLVTPTSLTALSGYVQQDDLFVGTLTVREHLVFQAMVRMDKHIPMEKRLQRVEEVMKLLGLTKTKDTVIGIQGRIKGISGGESKRLALASEVLTNPPLLFCDEPTSGLDSFMAANVMDMLGQLAKQGRTVICTIHQPSSQIFAKIDRLLLLAEGQVAYLGDARLAREYFHRRNYICPDDYNPADYFIETLAIQPGIEDECKERVKALCSQFQESEEGSVVAEEVRVQEKLIDFSDQEVADTRSPYKCSWLTQVGALFWRGWVSMVKEPMLMHVRFAQSVILGLILGFIYLETDLDQSGVMNLNGAIFVLLANISFSNVFAVVNTFCAELPIMLREHFNGMYRVDTYFITKQMVELPISILATSIFFVIFYFMIGLDRTPEKFFFALFIVNLVVQVVVSLGYLMSSISPNVEIGLAIAPVLLIPFMIFGGFFLNSQTVPCWLIWIKYLSWFFYGFESLMIIQWQDITNITCPGVQTGLFEEMDEDIFGTSFNMTGSGSFNMTGPGIPQGGDTGVIPCISNGEQVLTQLGFHKDNIGRDIGVLLALAVGMRILAYLALLSKTKRSKK